MKKGIIDPGLSHQPGPMTLGARAHVAAPGAQPPRVSIPVDTTNRDQ